MLKNTTSVEQAPIEGTPHADTGFHLREVWKSSPAAPTDDLQVVISDLSLRLAELERWVDRDGDADREAYRALARETLERHVPLADRMGMQVLRRRLEDASFRILEPRLYQELARRVEPGRAEDEICLAVLKAGITRLLDENGIVGTVEGRTKGLYSLYRKMCRLNCPLGSILDRIGLRVIVPSIAECYRVLELLHARFRPVPGTLDDYIAHPKANGYRSLHVCFYPVPDLSYKPVEFQIRTVQMHREARFGAAAHWRYKVKEETGLGGEARLKWLCGLLKQRKPALDHDAFIPQLCRQVLGDRLAVACRDGQVERLLAGATVDDF